MYEEGRQSGALAESLAASPAVTRLVLIGRQAAEPSGLSTLAQSKARVAQSDFSSGAGLNQLLDGATTDYLLLCRPGDQLELGQRAI